VLQRQLGYDLGTVSWRKVDASGGAHAVAEAARKLIAY
jgi:hypothetical protein